VADFSLMTKRLKQRCRSGWDNSKKISVRRVSRHWWSDGTSISVLVGNMSSDKCLLSTFEYHVFYVLYPFVSYLVTLPCMLKVKRWSVTI
jgi:hypothetical protein